MIKEKYCEIAHDMCPIDLINLYEKNCIFSAYSCHDETILSQIHDALNTLNNETDINWLKWEDDLDIENNLIFCEICKNIISSKSVLIELTDLNFNVIFEYGYSIGLNKKIHPTVNEKFDYADIERFLKPLIGVGISKYKNNRLAEKLKKKHFWEKENIIKIFNFPETEILTDDLNITCNKLLYIKNPDDQQVSEKIENAISDSNADIIIDDPAEDIYGLDWYSKQIKKSFAVLIDMGKSSTSENYHHFLKCAFIAGLSVSTGRRLLIVNSIHAKKPSDIITLVDQYRNPKEAKRFVHKFLNRISNPLSVINAQILTSHKNNKTKFESLDIGEHVAENDIEFIDTCFVKTPEFSKLKKLGYKLVIGRKGTGKTASFFKFKQYKKKNNEIVIHHMFDKYNLDDVYNIVKPFKVLNDKNKILEAIWKFVIISVIAINIKKHIEIIKISNSIIIDNEFLDSIKKVKILNNKKTITENLIDLIANVDKSNSVKEIRKIFLHDHYFQLRKDVIKYLTDSNNKLFLNIDGLDSNITVSHNNILIKTILFSLHEACASIFKRDFTNYSINLFLRDDIYQTFSSLITEKDKINQVFLKWDTELLTRLIDLRLVQIGFAGTFEILDDGFSIRELMRKLEKYVYSRPRDYIYIFNSFFQIAESLGKDFIDNKVFNYSIKEYINHISQSIRAEFISLQYNLDYDQFMYNMKHINNDKDRIPIDKLQEIFIKLGKQKYEFNLILFLLKIEFIYIMENNKIVKWNTKNNTDIKLQILLEDDRERKYFSIHPIIQALIKESF